ncbi:ABC transporter G family member 39 [Zea mays]|uniref:ABC transporter G family member 39 n=1 Tax=Zea mays TaxID=4577 RepID=A0A3L6D6X7_MAIZE|nr:ABC transporter G family member 39 [Zea mays]
MAPRSSLMLANRAKPLPDFHSSDQKIGDYYNSSERYDNFHTTGDLALIDWIKEIPCEPRVEVVLIDDAFVERKWMECLFQPDAYLGDEVIDCYINLIKAQEHLKCRSGGHVHIENVFQFNFLKRDGDVETKTDELYPSKDMAQISSAERRVLLYLDHDMGMNYLIILPRTTCHTLGKNGCYITIFRYKQRKGCPLYKYDKEVDTGCSSDVQILDSPTNPKKRKLLCVSEENEVLMEDDDGPITQADLERWFVHDWDKRTPIKIPTDECTNEFLLSGLSTKDMPVTKADLIDVLCDYIMTIQYDTTLEMTWMRSFKPFKIEISVKDLQNVLRVLMPWKFNGCYALFIIDHGKKHVTFIDFTPTQDWCKHMPYKRFAEAIIMVSKKYKIAYNKKRSGWADDIFKWEHTIRSGLPLDLKGVNTSYFVLQAMVMWGSGRRMEFNRATFLCACNCNSIAFSSCGEAAIEKLPTYDRMRKGILMGAAASVEEVDIQGLGMQERKNLIERLVRTAEEDNERFLLKLRDRMERVGIDNPTIEVHFENLNIDAEAYVGNRGVPAMTNFFSNKVMDVLSAMHIVSSGKRPVSILHDISGVIRPDRMSLLLGPPGSGKTSLLLALAGKLDSNLKVSGRVTYNGHDMDGFVPQRTSAYIGQHDVHVGKMTVRETLAFFARCQGVGTRYAFKKEKESNIKPDPDVDVYMKAISVEGQESVVTDYILKILGLEICADTMVGDSMIRGISGGQKKHVTTGICNLQLN